MVGGYQYIYQVAMEYPLQYTEEGLGMFVREGISIVTFDHNELPWDYSCPDKNTRILFRALLALNDVKINFYK